LIDETIRFRCICNYTCLWSLRKMRLSRFQNRAVGDEVSLKFSWLLALHVVKFKEMTYNLIAFLRTRHNDLNTFTKLITDNSDIVNRYCRRA
jgi:hypothetical protein